VKKNARLGITGLLIYRQKEFIQLLEGDKEAIFSVYQTICNDRRNFANFLMWEEPITQRSFPDWTMGYLAADGLVNKDQPGFAPFFDPSYSGLTQNATESTGKRFLSFHSELFFLNINNCATPLRAGKFKPN
jgi:hypothetical protein